MDSGDPRDDWKTKEREYTERKARAKALKLRLTCTICGASPKTLLNCPCGTTQYCSTACQRIDWRDRGHRKACKKIRNERAAEAARAEAPTPPPSLPVYGPAPRSHADEVRARIAAEHEAARARREANPEPEPVSARFGSRCPICMEEWDVNEEPILRTCCCRATCYSCEKRIGNAACPLCKTLVPRTAEAYLEHLRRHVENEVPEAIYQLAELYRTGNIGLQKNPKKAAKIFKRAAELGNAEAMVKLSAAYREGRGVKIDGEKSMQLVRMAADRGNAWAQCDIGFNLYNEENRECVHWMKLAAARGYTHAEVSLASWYMAGTFVDQSWSEAKLWFARAAAKGDEDAIVFLEGIQMREKRLREEASVGLGHA